MGRARGEPARLFATVQLLHRLLGGATHVRRDWPGLHLDVREAGVKALSIQPKRTQIQKRHSRQKVWSPTKSRSRDGMTIRKTLLAFVLSASALAQVQPPNAPPPTTSAPAPSSSAPPPPPATDKFGGLTALPSSGGATKFFRLEEAVRSNGSGVIKRWNLVS